MTTGDHEDRVIPHVGHINRNDSQSLMRVPTPTNIEPANPELHRLWTQFQETAAEAFKIADLIKTGVRDGDGYWHGSDVVWHIMQELERVVGELKRYYDHDRDIPF